MPRERTKTADRKAAIVEGALKVFSTYGFDAGTIRQIATEAGVAEGLIYHYFEGKEALLDAVIRERSILAWLAQPEALSDALPIEAALREFAAEGLARLARDADVFAVVWSQMATNRALAERVGRIVREVTDRLAAYLDRKIAKGELRPVDTVVAARVVAASLVLFTLAQYRLSPPLKHLAPDAYTDGLVDVLVHGLARRDAARQQGGPSEGGERDQC
jgi:AcrR family transcriptional regulator